MFALCKLNIHLAAEGRRRRCLEGGRKAPWGRVQWKWRGTISMSCSKSENYIWAVCDLETQLWRIILSCSLESKWSFFDHVLSLFLQDSEIWAIRVKQLIGLLACLTWFVQYYLLLDPDFSQLIRKSKKGVLLSNCAVLGWRDLTLWGLLKG